MKRYVQSIHSDFQFHITALNHCTNNLKPNQYKTTLDIKKPYKNSIIDEDTAEYIASITLPEKKLKLFYIDDDLLAIYSDRLLFVQEQEDPIYTGYLTAKIFEILAMCKYSHFNQPFIPQIPQHTAIVEELITSTGE